MSLNLAHSHSPCLNPTERCHESSLKREDLFLPVQQKLPEPELPSKPQAWEEGGVSSRASLPRRREGKAPCPSVACFSPQLATFSAVKTEALISISSASQNHQNKSQFSVHHWKEASAEGPLGVASPSVSCSSHGSVKAEVPPDSLKPSACLRCPVNRRLTVAASGRASSSATFRLLSGHAEAAGAAGRGPAANRTHPPQTFLPLCICSTFLSWRDRGKHVDRHRGPGALLGSGCWRGWGSNPGRGASGGRVLWEALRVPGLSRCPARGSDGQRCQDLSTLYFNESEKQRRQGRSGSAASAREACGGRAVPSGGFRKHSRTTGPRLGRDAVRRESRLRRSPFAVLPAGRRATGTRTPGRSSPATQGRNPRPRRA